MKNREDLIKYEAKMLKKFPGNEPICCVCGHKLSSHVGEGDFWRCHSLMTFDLYQCECCLRKDRAEGDINYYNTQSRIKEQMLELSDGIK